MSKRFGLTVVLFLLSMGLLAAVNAQTSTVGNISGYVRDPQGAAVPKAEVTITEERTGASRTVMSDDDGFYSAPSLAVGRYSVSTSPHGFKKLVAGGIDLHVAESRGVKPDLQLGQVSETVKIGRAHG